MSKKGIERDIIKLGGGIEAFEEWTLTHNKKVKRYNLHCTECGKFKKEEDVAEIKYRDLHFKVCGDCVWDAIEKIAKELNDGTLICEKE